jgi:hypothetical protein
VVRASAIVAALLLLAACGPSPVEKAQREVDFLEKNGGSNAEKCAAYTKLADAYRDAENAKEWQLAKVMQDSTCYLAENEMPNVDMNDTNAFVVENTTSD